MLPVGLFTDMLLENEGKKDQQKCGQKTSKKTSNYGIYNLKMPQKIEPHGNSYIILIVIKMTDEKERRKKRSHQTHHKCQEWEAAVVEDLEM